MAMLSPKFSPLPSKGMRGKYEAQNLFVSKGQTRADLRPGAPTKTVSLPTATAAPLFALEKPKKANVLILLLTLPPEFTLKVKARPLSIIELLASWNGAPMTMSALLIAT